MRGPWSAGSIIAPDRAAQSGALPYPVPRGELHAHRASRRDHRLHLRGLPHRRLSRRGPRHHRPLAEHRGQYRRGHPDPLRGQHHPLLRAVRARARGGLRADAGARGGHGRQRRHRHALRRQRRRRRRDRGARLWHRRRPRPAAATALNAEGQARLRAQVLQGRHARARDAALAARDQEGPCRPLAERSRSRAGQPSRLQRRPRELARDAAPVPGGAQARARRHRAQAAQVHGQARASHRPLLLSGRDAVSPGSAAQGGGSSRRPYRRVDVVLRAVGGVGGARGPVSLHRAGVRHGRARATAPGRGTRRHPAEDGLRVPGRDRRERALRHRHPARRREPRRAAPRARGAGQPLGHRALPARRSRRRAGHPRGLRGRQGGRAGGSLTGDVDALPRPLMEKRGGFYALVRLFGRFWVWFFFREVDVQHAERVPRAGPVLLCVNHPNNLIDSLTVSAVVERKVHYLATAALFRNALLGKFLKACGAIPVYRRQDDPDKMDKNAGAFEATVATLARGEFVAIYPEGTTHSESRIQRIKTGAARIALDYESRRAGGLGEVLTLIPTGLTSEARKSFGGRVRISVGEPIPITPYLEVYREDGVKAVDGLTTAIQWGMEAQVLHVDRLDRASLVREVEAVYKDDLIRELQEERGLAPRQIDTVRLSRGIADAAAYFEAHAPERLDAIREHLVQYRAMLAAYHVRDQAVRARLAHPGVSERLSRGSKASIG